MAVMPTVRYAKWTIMPNGRRTDKRAIMPIVRYAKGAIVPNGRYANCPIRQMADYAKWPLCIECLYRES
jgi:hypothetical protein